MNYVRKLGFEETPDYDFLRELFTKMLKDAGEVDDGVMDWMLLNGGKGWEASVRIPRHGICAISRGHSSHYFAFYRLAISTHHQLLARVVGATAITIVAGNNLALNLSLLPNPSLPAPTTGYPRFSSNHPKHRLVVRQLPLAFRHLARLPAVLLVGRCK